MASIQQERVDKTGEKIRIPASLFLTKKSKVDEMQSCWMVYSLVLPNSIGKQQFFASIIPAFLDPAWERSITFSNTNMCQIPFMMTAAISSLCGYKAKC